MNQSAQPTPLHTVIEGRTPLAGRVRFSVDESWGQGRTIFGGMLSALAVQAMRDVCGSEWPLRALQTSFVAPVSPGVVEVEVILLRQGKNVRQVKANVMATGPDGIEQVAGVLLGVFGGGRESAIPRRMPEQIAVAKAPQDCFQLPFMPGVTPNFTQHMDFRLAEGAYPFTGSTDTFTRTHVAMRQGECKDSELLTVMFADAGPTPALAMLKGPAPASSVSWALELRPVALGDVDGFWRMDKEALAIDEGYVNEKTTLWTPSGQLAALGYQVVAVYG
jgi:acyl-CoA thioesterase